MANVICPKFIPFYNTLQKPSPRQPTARRALYLCHDQGDSGAFGLDSLRDLTDFEALEDAGLLSTDKLLAEDIPVSFASMEDGNNEDAR